MANHITPAKAIRVTVVDSDGKSRTKTFMSAKTATKWYSMASWHRWWCKTGHLNPNADRHARSAAYFVRLNRRVLPIMKHHL